MLCPQTIIEGDLQLVKGLIRRCYGVDGTFVIHWSSKDQPSEGEPSPYSIKVHDLDRSSTGWNP